MSTRVLVVDDAVLFRRAVSDALTGLPGVEVVGTASNGKLALARIQELRPDLVTLDIEMPEMNGIQFLEQLGAMGTIIGTIVLSSVTRRGGELTLKALALGAFDFITKPETESAAGGMAELRSHLAPMIRAFQRRCEIRSLEAAPKALPVPAVDNPPAPVARRLNRSGSPIVLIGVSTGGPAALMNLLPALPADFNAPVFLVQHMPPMFTEALANSLQAKCSLRVVEAKDNEVGLSGWVYVAPGGRHLKIVPGSHGEVVMKVIDDPPENNCRPAVDVLFRSAALNFPGRSVAAVLTGMGQDGTQGLKLLKRGGCFSIAQDEATCVVFGMPKAVIDAGLADSVLPLQAIAPALVRQVNEARK